MHPTKPDKHVVVDQLCEHKGFIADCRRLPFQRNNAIAKEAIT